MSILFVSCRFTLAGNGLQIGEVPPTLMSAALFARQFFYVWRHLANVLL